VEEHTKIVVDLRLYMESYLQVSHSINTLKDDFVCSFTNTINFSIIPFDSYFIHTMKYVSMLVPQDC